jgi:hypothetical protein
MEHLGGLGLRWSKCRNFGIIGRATFRQFRYVHFFAFGLFLFALKKPSLCLVAGTVRFSLRAIEALSILASAMAMSCASSSGSQGRFSLRGAAINLPAASSPSAQAPPGGRGPGVSLECPIVCGWRETPFQRELSPPKLRPRGVVAVFDPQAKIAFFDRSFCLPPSRTLLRGITVRPSPLVQARPGGGSCDVPFLISDRRPASGLWRWP